MTKRIALFLLVAILASSIPAHSKKTRIKAKREPLVQIDRMLLDNSNWFPGDVLETRRALAARVEEMFPQNGLRSLRPTSRGERLAAEATAMMVDWRDLKWHEVSRTYSLENTGSTLCRFPGFRASSTECSAFLAKKDRVVTAAHCLRRNFPCEDYGFVFGLTSGSTTDAFNGIPEDRVRRCKREIGRGRENPPGSKLKDVDWVIFEVDAVRGIEPLHLDPRLVRFGRNMLYVGHPNALPSTVSEGEAVSRPEDLSGPYFETTLDILPGSSGSPVFRKGSINRGRPRVIGIVSHGTDPFRYFPFPEVPLSCEEFLMPCSKRDDEQSCEGTRVTRAAEFFGPLQGLQ